MLDVGFATAARRRVDAEAKAALDAQHQAIRSALEAGVPAYDLAQAVGMTPARIYQIRDGVR